MSSQIHVRGAMFPGKNPVLIEWEAGWASQPVWTFNNNNNNTELQSVSL